MILVQCEKRSKVKVRQVLENMARPERLELPTTWFEARYSIQLSYGRIAAGKSGAPGEIRTPDPLVRSQVLYPTELRAHIKRCEILDSHLRIVKRNVINIQDFPLKRELLPGINAGAVGNPPLALKGSLAPPEDPQLFVAIPALASCYVALEVPQENPSE